MDLRAEDVMTSPVVSVAEGTLVREVARTLSRKRISGVLVLDEEEAVVGVVTESDLVQRVAHPHLPPHVEILGAIIYLQTPGKMEASMRKMVGTTAGEVMSTEMVEAAPSTPVVSIADLMVEHNARRVLVMDEGRPVGIITRGDLVRKLLAGIEEAG